MCVCACLLVILVVGDECVFRGCVGMVCVCVCACLLVILVVGDECVFRGCAGMVCVCVCMSPRDSCSRR